MLRILFFCTVKSGRSQIAASFARSMAPNYIEVIAAGDKCHQLHENAVRVMNEIQFDIPLQVENKLEDIKYKAFDVVITLCNKAKEMCPVFPGSPARIHWPSVDPLSIENFSIKDFRKVRDELKTRINSLFKFGYIDSIREVRMLFGTLLDNMTDGVMAHDMDRRIFFFNPSAQEITGYTLEDVIGKDCHEIFPGRFCGGDCSFCDDKTFSSNKINYPRDFTTKKGEIRNLEMTVVNLNPPNNKMIGAMVIFRDNSEVINLRKRLSHTRGLNVIIGNHTSMTKVFEAINRLADITLPILIQGETGTGKEMVAMALHQLSNKSDGPFVPVNCSALPEGTLESELFGHVKGAFTGAIRDHKGRFELAESGTIFLDEIGELSHTMQVKLLRVMQEREFTPVGGEKVRQMKARIICATNKDLKELTKKGLFREDLYYRLAVVPISLPSLRERRSDIPLLTEHFLELYSPDIGKRIKSISDAAMNKLMNYDWPGNVRELRNSVQYAMIKCNVNEGTIGIEHLPVEILEQEEAQQTESRGRPVSISSELIQNALKQAGGNKAKAAKILNVSRTTIYRFIKDEKV